MIGYIFMFKMVKKMQNLGIEIVAGLTRPLNVYESNLSFLFPQEFTT